MPLTLGDQINIGTRSLHTRLNRGITSRLPLCLPPHCDTPEIYTFGFAHFAHVYLAFEKAWGTVIAREEGDKDRQAKEHEEKEEQQWVEVESYAESLQEADRTATIETLLNDLKSLRPAGLERSQRIYQDLSRLQACSQTQAQAFLDSVLADSPATQAFVSHIHQAIESRPHILLAYAWTMYMAVFSGGRWIRSELSKAGPEFWTEATSNDPLLMNQKLTFWSFPEGTQDGVDIKMEFKANLADVEQRLSVQQKEDIVREAVNIFEMCLAVVDELDARYGGSAKSTEQCVAVSTEVAAATKEILSVPKRMTLPSGQLLSAAAVGLGVSAWLATAGTSYLAFLVQ